MKIFYAFAILLITLCSCTDSGDTFLPSSPVHTNSATQILQSGDSVSFHAFNTKIPVIAFENGKSLSTCQQNAVTFFENNQDKLFEKIKEKIFEYYQSAYPDYKNGWSSEGNLDDSQIQRYLPYPAFPDSLLSHIKPVTFIVHSSANCEENSFSIEFDCTWDIENGLGVEIDNGEVKFASMAQNTYLR
jgi:hypothetical protein